MQSTGMVRDVDSVGRVVIPKEIRDSLGLVHGSPMEILVNGRDVVLRSYKPGCQCCGDMTRPMRSKNGVNICTVCLSEMAGK